MFGARVCVFVCVCVCVCWVCDSGLKEQQFKFKIIFSFRLDIRTKYVQDISDKNSFKKRK